MELCWKDESMEGYVDRWSGSAQKGGCSADPSSMITTTQKRAATFDLIRPRCSSSTDRWSNWSNNKHASCTVDTIRPWTLQKLLKSREDVHSLGRRWWLHYREPTKSGETMRISLRRLHCRFQIGQSASRGCTNDSNDIDRSLARERMEGPRIVEITENSISTCRCCWW
jgi:hypothetical protein